MKVPKLPKALDMPSIPLKQPTAEMPVFPPIVIPPGNIKAPAGVTLDEAPAEKELEGIEFNLNEVNGEQV